MKMILSLLIVLPMAMVSCFAVGEHCQYANKVMHSYSKKVKKEKDLDAFGMGGELMTNVKSFSLTYVSERKLNIDEARPLIVECIEDLLKDINDYKEIRPYLNDYPFTVKNLEFGIMFMKPNGDIIRDGHLADVTSLNGKILYRIRPLNTNRFKKIYEETYEEALRIVREGEAKRGDGK